MSALMSDKEVLELADEVLAGDFDFDMGSAPLKIAAICRMLKRCNEADRRDAARYRWLKANHLQTGTDSWIRTGDDLEEAIDAAMRQSAPVKP